MCGRYSNGADSFRQLRLDAYLPEVDQWEPNYNIAPNPKAGTEPWILRANGGGTLVEKRARWWLIPSWWSKPLSDLSTTFNARSETAANKPFFRQAYKNRRCAVPATGWREFKGPSRPKKAFQFHMDRPFAFAGLWEAWTEPGGETVESFTILTAPASGAISNIHPRMPIVLPSESFLPWIQDSANSASILEQAIASQSNNIQVYETTSFGNSTRASGPACIEPAPTGAQAPAPPIQGELF